LAPVLPMMLVTLTAFRLAAGVLVTLPAIVYNTGSG